jgi:phytoene desaturase
MYLVGGGTHPGSGLPVIFESARISSRLLLEEFGIPSKSLTSGRPSERPPVPREKSGVFATMANMLGINSMTTS